MARTYVYWRRPDGRPHKQSDDKYSPSSLLAALGATSTLQTGGGISWPFYASHEYELAIQSTVIIEDPSGAEICSVDAASIVWSAIKTAIRESGGGKPILPGPFLDLMNKLAAEFCRRPVADYFLLTTLSLGTIPCDSIRIGEHVISAPSRRKKYDVPKALQIRRQTGEFPNESASNYLKIKITSRGRSTFEAVDKALDCMHLIRGLWTLFATYGYKVSHLGTSKDKPIGVIHTGQVHTLHQRDGALAADFFWYEPDHGGERDIFKPKAGWAEVDGLRRWATRRISRLPYRKSLEQLIRRYATALDHINLDIAFLQMWSILEKITDTAGTSYDQTIERTTWVYRDRNEAKELLQHLRLRRNRYVHAATTSDQRDQAVYMIKSFVDPHLVRLIRNDFGVSSLEEYGRFLSGPTDEETLVKLRKTLTRQIRFQKARAAGK